MESQSVLAHTHDDVNWLMARAGGFSLAHPFGGPCRRIARFGSSIPTARLNQQRVHHENEDHVSPLLQRLVTGDWRRPPRAFGTSWARVWTPNDRIPVTPPRPSLDLGTEEGTTEPVFILPELFYLVQEVSRVVTHGPQRASVDSVSPDSGFGRGNTPGI
jgi:hypothetical protein